MTTTHVEISLRLVNRTLRQAGQCEAHEHEEASICTWATLGHDIRWIGAQVMTARAIAWHGDIILGA